MVFSRDRIECGIQRQTKTGRVNGSGKKRKRKRKRKRKKENRKYSKKIIENNV